MKEKELLEKLAAAWDECTPKEAGECLEQLFAVIKQGLKEHGEVTTSIGKFKLQHKPAREAINPLTKEKVKVDAKTVVKFAPNKKLKDEFVGVKVPKKK